MKEIKKATEEMYLIEVKVKSSLGYTPRTCTYKGIGIAKNKRSHSELAEKAILDIRSELSAQNPGVDIPISAIASLYSCSFVIHI